MDNLLNRLPLLTAQGLYDTTVETGWNTEAGLSVLLSENAIASGFELRNVCRSIMDSKENYSIPIAMALVLRAQTFLANVDIQNASMIETHIYPQLLRPGWHFGKTYNGSGTTNLRVCGLMTTARSHALSAWIMDPTQSPPAITTFGQEPDMNVSEASSVFSKC